MSGHRPKETASGFRQALGRLAQQTGVPHGRDIDRLSKPTKDDLADFRADWPGIVVERRRAIVRAMNEVAEQSVQYDFTDLLIAILGDPDDQVRARAIGGLWECEIPSVCRNLLRMLDEDRSALVRAAAAEGLGHYLERAENGRLQNPSALTLTNALLSHIDDPTEDLEVRRRALESVAESSDERVHDAIQRAYAEDDEAMRASAVFAMGRSADQSWSHVVLNELSNSDPAMRYESAYAAGELTIADALPHLRGLLNDADVQVRQAAVWALGQIGGREARRALEAVLEGDDEALYEAADDALAEIAFAAGETPFQMFEFDVDEGSVQKKTSPREAGDEDMP